MSFEYNKIILKEQPVLKSANELRKLSAICDIYSAAVHVSGS